MKNVKFKFKLESQGALANVELFPEQESCTIRIETNSNRKKWTNNEFELSIIDPFEYKLKVFGVSGTKWKATLTIVRNGAEIPFISWNGTTGDTRRNISERKKPEKNIPTSTKKMNKKKTKNEIT